MRRAHRRGGRLRPQREALPVQLVDEAVHLLLDDVGGLADRAPEERGVLEQRRADVAVAVGVRPRAHDFLEALPQRGLVRQDVVHPPDRLDGLGHLQGRPLYATAFSGSFGSVAGARRPRPLGP